MDAAHFNLQSLADQISALKMETKNNITATKKSKARLAERHQMLAAQDKEIADLRSESF
jgi:hypothetical protein